MSIPTIHPPLDERTRCCLLPEKDTLGETELRELTGIDPASSVPGDHRTRREQSTDSLPEKAPADDILDEALEQTFPASDAVAVVLPGHG